MEEEYLLNKMIKGKTEKEREIELMQNIIETKEKLQNARKNFEYAEDGMIDYYIYQIKANQSKLDYLCKILPCFIRPCFYHPYLPHVLYHRLFQVVLLTS